VGHIFFFISLVSLQLEAMLEVLWQALNVPPNNWFLTSFTLKLVLITILVPNNTFLGRLEHGEIIDIAQLLQLVRVLAMLLDKLLCFL
jgi:hypothetical protein